MRYHDYIAALTQLADEEGFAFVDVTAGATDQFSRDADYSDYHHMSPEGAGHFTLLLAAAVTASTVADPARSAATRTIATRAMPEQMALGLHRGAAVERK